MKKPLVRVHGYRFIPMLKLTLTLSLFLCAAVVWAADPASFQVVSAASSTAGIAPDSLASIYGDKLATITKAASAPPWPTSLGDMPVVYIRDSANQTFMAGLIFVSPSQMNIWIPAGVAAGPAVFSFPVTGLPIGVGTAALRNETVNINAVAPALFSIDGTGSGVAAATAIRFAIPAGFQSLVPVFNCTAPGKCTAVPIDVGIDEPVYLTLYGTGIRGGGSNPVTVNFGGTTVLATYAGPQPQFPGLDQVNVPLSLNLRGSGLVPVTVTVNGVTSNAVLINIQ
jgi:uncharacterized protein (TIGR03437 family)